MKNGRLFWEKWFLKMGRGFEASAAHLPPNQIWEPPGSFTRARVFTIDLSKKAIHQVYDNCIICKAKYCQISWYRFLLKISMKSSLDIKIPRHFLVTSLSSFRRYQKTANLLIFCQYFVNIFIFSHPISKKSLGNCWFLFPLVVSDFRNLTNLLR